MSSIEKIPALLVHFNGRGYASGTPSVQRRNDGTHRIALGYGEAMFEDVWWGGNPFSGQESIALGKTVLWAMQYRGGMEPGHEAQAGETFTFLRRALSECSEAEPLRGPAEFNEGDWLYANSWEGTLSEFEGREKIWHDSEHVYTGKYFGGAVAL